MCVKCGAKTVLRQECDEYKCAGKKGRQLVRIRPQHNKHLARVTRGMPSAGNVYNTNTLPSFAFLPISLLH